MKRQPPTGSSILGKRRTENGFEVPIRRVLVAPSAELQEHPAFSSPHPRIPGNTVSGRTVIRVGMWLGSRLVDFTLTEIRKHVG